MAPRGARAADGEGSDAGPGPGVDYQRRRVMRHTAVTWLVQDGVDLDLYRVQALIGHEDFCTTVRYAHHAPEANEEVLASWGRTPLERPGAPEAHKQRKGPSGPG